jgi:hypothetical protein
MSFLRVGLLAVAFAAGMHFVDWWAVPLIGAIYGLLIRRARAPREAMFGALLGTVALLLPQALLPAFMRLLEQLGSIFRMPGVAVLGLTVLIAMILAFTSARVAVGVAGTREPVVRQRRPN